MSKALADALAIHRFTEAPGDLQERMALRTTHRRVWSGAQTLLNYLVASKAQLGLMQPGVRVLELGSGAGWLGLNLAAAVPNMELTMSELPLATPALRAHVRRIGALEPSICKRVHVVELDWEAALASPAPPWTYIIGSELLYSHAGLRALPRAIAALAAPSTRILYMHVPGRKASVDAELHPEFLAAGLVLTPVEVRHTVDLSHAADVVPAVDDSGDEEESGAAWIPDGGLFAEEDSAWRSSRPSPVIFEVTFAREYRRA